MIVKNLTLKNFRNYENAFFSYSDGLNVIRGKNAQGKTNSAEALFLLCTGYSPRVKSDKQVVKYNENSAVISANAVGRYGEIKVETDFFVNDKKIIKINDVEVKKIGELLGNVNSVFFNPGELKLIKESPEDRRRFMDISISQMNKKYFYSLQQYKKILLQRNNLLKDSAKDMIYETIPLWDEMLTSSAAEIIMCRNEFVKLLSPLAKEVHSYITAGSEELVVKRNVAFDGTVDDIKNQLLKELSERLEKDIVLGYTSVGPHRDDLKILINGEDVKLYASQGQQRTAALSLKLAELEIFKGKFGEYPLLILDDALSELDETRQIRLLNRIKGIQTIITLTEISKDVFGGFEYSETVVENGRIISEQRR